MAALTSRGRDDGLTSAPASERMSSTAKTFAGSAIATTSLPSSQPIGIAW
jgi:hypothetical protein